MKNEPKQEAKFMNNPEKWPQQIDAEKSTKKRPTPVRFRSTPWAPEHLQFNKMLRRKSTKVNILKKGDQQRGPTLEEKQRGANILEVKYQKVTYRGYFTAVKYEKGDLQEVFYY